MKITEVRCALVGSSPVVRVMTDGGIDGFAELEPSKAHLVPVVEHVGGMLVGSDPTQVNRCAAVLRRLGGFKPWGAAVSAVEIALWDIAGRAHGVPVHELLGGRMRERIRVYDGGRRPGLRGHTPEDYAASMAIMRDAEEGFTIFKEGVGFHGFMAPNTPDFFYGELRDKPLHPNRGRLTPSGYAHVVECATAMKEVLGPDRALALDMGPGFTLADGIRILRELEPVGLIWAEDLLTGDSMPWSDAQSYRELTRSTTVPTHTGEQIYLRQGYRELISTQAVRVIGPDPCDVGGLAELKWVAEYADLYGIEVAPHGVTSGLFGLAALIQVCATLPDNLLAFEYPVATDDWWYQVVTGLPERIVTEGFVDVLDGPGLGIDFDRSRAAEHLAAGYAGFFDGTGWPA